MRRSQKAEPGAESDSEVFREVLAGLQRSEARQTELNAGAQNLRAKNAARSSSRDTDQNLDRIPGLLTGHRAAEVNAQMLEQVALGRPLLEVLNDLCKRLEESDAERRRGHAQLSEGQRLSKTGSFTSDLLFDQHSWSEEYYRIFQLDLGTRPSVEAVRDRVHPDDLQLFDAEIQRGMAGGDADFTFRIVTPGGGLKHLRGVARVVEHVAGRPIFMGTVQDITEGKLAEAALKASEANLRQAYSYLTEAQRLSKTGSFTWDVLADEHNWSEEIRRIFGFDLEAKISIAMIQGAIYPDDKTEVERVIGGAVEGRDFDLTFRIRTTSGALRHAHVVGHRIEHIVDRPVFLGALQDVTESKVAEAALRAREADLRRANRYLTEAQRLSSTGSFTWDPARGEQDWSEELYRIWECNPGEALSLGDIIKNVHRDDAPGFGAELDRALATGDDYELFYRIKTQSGAVKHLHTVGQRMGEIGDRFVYIGATQDVTESRLAEEALKGSERELRRANSHLTIAQRLSKTGSFTWDLTTNERQWSEEMYRIFEIEPRGPVPSAVARETVHPDDLPVIDALLTRAREGKDFDVEFRLIAPRGVVKHVHVVGNLLNAAMDRPVFVGALQDVTDRKIAEQGLGRARGELAHVARATALSTITASIAHEVNQPLAGIITNASTCLRMLALDPPNIEGAQLTAQRTIRDGNRASEVITRLRALFAGKPPGNELVDVNDAAREILLLSSSELQSARVVLQTDFAGDLPTVFGDRVQLQQVILNLVLNAAQALRGIDGRPHDLRVSTARHGPDHVTLAVRDSGVGVDAEKLERLFDAFYTTKPDGMGVGLSVSRSIIEAHGGCLWASANDGPGLTVSFSIPLTGSSSTGSSVSPRPSGL